LKGIDELGRVGDITFAVNGERFTVLADLTWPVEKAGNGKAGTVALLRNGSPPDVVVVGQDING